MLSRAISSVEKIETIAPIIYGSVGYGAGIEFVSFIKVYKNLPDVDAILRGDSIDVPDEPSALYALCSAIVEKFSTQEEAKNLFAYSKNLPVEFCVMLIKDLIIKDESIAEVDGFDEWIEKYGEYIL
jgi:hypothetical protein